MRFISFNYIKNKITLAVCVGDIFRIFTDSSRFLMAFEKCLIKILTNSSES